ncbi:hypothetical protein C8Q75DRAFT_806361 [Abortiporus biennis]|nr:hypothetical protein C8Q75DRAFT_806361 [Abortiporus biennis]
MSIAKRYLSIATLVVSNVGYFGNFSLASCHNYYIVAPIFKILQTTISQVILGLRTYNISSRSRWAMWTLIILFFLITSMQAFTNLFARTPVQKAGNCTAANESGRLFVWLYYVLAMAYDIITLGISTYFLMRSTRTVFRMSGLVKLMFYDGLVYFVVLCGTFPFPSIPRSTQLIIFALSHIASNVVNLILYRASNEEIQSSGASIGYAVTWILTQRLLIHLRDAAAKVHGPSRSRSRTHTITQPMTSTREIIQAMRSFETKSKEQTLDHHHHHGRQNQTQTQTREDEEHASMDSYTYTKTEPDVQSFQLREGADENGDVLHRDHDGGHSGGGDALDEEFLDVLVRVEHTVTVDYDPSVYERESYRRPRQNWEVRPK